MIFVGSELDYELQHFKTLNRFNQSQGIVYADNLLATVWSVGLYRASAIYFGPQNTYNIGYAYTVKMCVP